MKLLLSLILLLLQPALAQGNKDCEGLLANDIHQSVLVKKGLAQVLIDPLVEEARQLKAFDDFKILSDMSPRKISKSKRSFIEALSLDIERNEGRLKAVRFLVSQLYDYKKELLPVSDPLVEARYTTKHSKHKATLEHIERKWSELFRKTPAKTASTLIPLPSAVLIPGSRFQEAYYWDTFFAMPALLSTGREKLVRGLIDNFLFLIENYGLVPNGGRQYYLSRSQPPLLSQMIRIYIEHKKSTGTFSTKELEWVRSKVLPLIERDYLSFWMDPRTRYNKKLGLNHHFDLENAPRPERHSSDNEEVLAKTYRDVRAECESGKDFTDAFCGEATKYAGVLLNSILFQVEMDIHWMYGLVGQKNRSMKFLNAANLRKQQMYKYLWDDRDKVFRDLHMGRFERSSVITADAFVPFYVGLISKGEAYFSAKILLEKLERRGGLMSSDVKSGKQWDAPYGWAPHHYFAIQGLDRYGLTKSADRLAKKWLKTVDNVFSETGKVIEKYDMTSKGAPREDGDKYETQEGFAWTNGVYVWALTYLGVDLSFH